MLRSMEGNSPAHELPEIYRAVLERIASLEQTGHRSEAEHIRREAITAYSRAWDEASRRRLQQLRLRADKAIESGERARREPAPPAAVGSPRPA